MTRNELGRHVFGLASIGFGLFALIFHDFNIWQPITPLGVVALHDVFLYLYAAATIFGGIAIQWRRTSGVAAIVLSVTYLFFALLWLPRWLAKPQSYDPLGNFFEEFSMVSAALIVYASTLQDRQRATNLARFGYYGFGICVVSFTLGQALYLRATAQLVPAWIPPGQMFWAVVTTVAFALAAIALLSGRAALLAAQLTTAMIVGFGLLVWLPAPFADPHSNLAWAGNAENLAIAGAAWIVADYLQRRKARA
jgi:uncharacterized membrane protein YphA (DoxX/SURF4 family)